MCNVQKLVWFIENNLLSSVITNLKKIIMINNCFNKSGNWKKYLLKINNLLDLL